MGLGGFALEGGLAGGGFGGPGGGAGVGVGGFGAVVELGGFLAHGLQTGGFGAESADLLSAWFGDEIAHVGILS